MLCRAIGMHIKDKFYILLISVLLSVPAVGANLNEMALFANQGNVDAQYNLGVMYEKGEGVRQDYRKAIEWYEKSANQGYAAAQYNLGLMYYQGKGVRQDYHKAKWWFGTACDFGYQMGCYGYKIISQARY